MRERDIEKAVCKYAEEKGWLQRKFESPNHSVPDRIFFKAGVCFLIEFKSSTGKPTERQMREINRLREKHIRVYIVNDIDRGKEVIGIMDTLIYATGGF